MVEIQAEPFQGTLVILKAKQTGSGVAQESVRVCDASVKPLVYQQSPEVRLYLKRLTGVEAAGS